jgi:hypothetical protein
VNDPVYFRDFAAALAPHGLTHLADADLTTLSPESLSAAMSPADRAFLEQTLDFMSNRRFRASLLVRASEYAPRAPGLADLAGFHLSSRAVASPRPAERAMRDRTPVTFVRDTRRVVLTDPVAKCALLSLVEAARVPQSFPSMCERAATRAGVTDNRTVATAIARELDLPALVFGGFVDLHAGPARYAAVRSERPLACPLARDQAARGGAVSTRRLTQVEPGPFERWLLQRLDGSRDRAALVRDADAAAATGALGPVDTRKGTLARRVDEALESFRLDALLLA